MRTRGPNTEGEIRWADLNPVRGREQAGRRPVLVMSHDVFNERSGTVIAVAMTSQEPRAGFPLALESTAAGLPKRSWVRIGQIRTLAVERIGRRLRAPLSRRSITSLKASMRSSDDDLTAAIGRLHAA